MKVITGCGGRFTLSDNSHGPHAVGLNYSQVGINELWFLERSKETNSAGRFVQPRKVEGEWWHHPFWAQFDNA